MRLLLWLSAVGASRRDVAPLQNTHQPHLDVATLRWSATWVHGQWKGHDRIEKFREESLVQIEPAGSCTEYPGHAFATQLVVRPATYCIGGRSWNLDANASGLVRFLAKNSSDTVVVAHRIVYSDVPAEDTHLLTLLASVTWLLEWGQADKEEANFNACNSKAISCGTAFELASMTRHRGFAVDCGPAAMFALHVVRRYTAFPVRLVKTFVAPAAVTNRDTGHTVLEVYADLNMDLKRHPQARSRRRWTLVDVDQHLIPRHHDSGDTLSALDVMAATKWHAACPHGHHAYALDMLTVHAPGWRSRLPSLGKNSSSGGDSRRLQLFTPATQLQQWGDGDHLGRVMKTYGMYFGGALEISSETIDVFTHRIRVEVAATCEVPPPPRACGDGEHQPSGCTAADVEYYERQDGDSTVLVNVSTFRQVFYALPVARRRA